MKYKFILNTAFHCLTLCLVFSLSGCSFFKINQDRREVNAAVVIKGTIQHASSFDNAIVVGLFAPSLLNKKPKLVQSTVVYGNSPFEFLIPAGKYYLAAFEDLNQDLIIQSTESAAWYGKPNLIKAEVGKTLKEITLQLKPPAQVVKELPFLYKEAKENKIKLENAKTLGKKITLESPVLSPNIGKMGMWQPLNFIRAENNGIFFLQDYDANKIPVIFVHGIGGTGGMLKTLISNIDRNNFQPWIIQYPSGLRLDLIASHVSSDINKLRTKYQFDQYAVVAHSMGGLVARSIIGKQLAQNNSPEIPLFVSISTPWNGHKAAVLGVKGAPVTVPVWFDIVPNSPYLKRLHQQISASKLNHHLFFSYKGRLSLVNAENNDGTVDLSSQLIPVVQTKAREVYGYNNGHVDVLENPALISRVNGLLAKLKEK